MKIIGITVNQKKPKAVSVTKCLLQLLEEKGSKGFIEPHMGQELARMDLALTLEEFPEQVEIIFVVGGDGTLLGKARQFAEHHLPILGINVGNLGFLSEAEPENLSTAVDRVLAGDYYIEERLMLCADLIRKKEVIKKGIALNDIGITKGSFSRIITCKVQMDGTFLDEFSGDGLIVSTPTGSTAYSLSCGGPIVSPEVQTILLTPICPHTLTSRPLILPAETTLEINVTASHREINVTIDGQVNNYLEPEDTLRVYRSHLRTLLIKWKERSFFDVVRRKFHGCV